MTWKRSWRLMTVFSLSAVMYSGLRLYSGSETAYPASVSCGRISPEEEEEIRKLYHTYEFSDRFHVISRSRIHGTLFDYMDQGILSAEELAAVWMR